MIESIDREGVRWSSGAVGKVEGLLLFLGLLSLWFDGVDGWQRAAIWAGVLFYAAFVVSVRYVFTYRVESRAIVVAETWAMIAFITWAVWFTDKLNSPLRNAYLLAIAIGALTVGMRTTMYQLALVAACIALTGEAASAQVFSLAYLSGMVARLTPLAVVAYVTAMFAADLRYGMSKTRLLGEIDEVTGLHNMRGFAVVADRLFGQAARDNEAASLLTIGIDNIIAATQADGSDAGNALLRATAKCIKTELRHGDAAARRGEGEFVAILQGTSAGGAMDVAERIRSAVAAAAVEFEPRKLSTTVSVGIASWVGSCGGIDAALARAARAMQLAREQGRSRAATLPV